MRGPELKDLAEVEQGVRALKAVIEAHLALQGAREDAFPYLLATRKLVLEFSAQQRALTQQCATLQQRIQQFLRPISNQAPYFALVAALSGVGGSLAALSQTVSAARLERCSASSLAELTRLWDSLQRAQTRSEELCYR